MCKKTKALLVTGKRLRKRMVQDTGKMGVKTDNAEIEQVANHKLLGMIIDEDLTYEVHVDKLCDKLSKRLGLLRQQYSTWRHRRISYIMNLTLGF